MDLNDLKVVATSKAARQLLLTRKHSPKIMFVAGVVGVVGTVVLACKATLKLDEVLDEHEKNSYIAQSKEYRVNGPESAEKDLAKLKVKLALNVTKLYAPAVGVGALSVGLLTGSHVVLTKRNTAVMAAYAALDRAHKQYRERVTEALGEDVDREFANGLVDHETTEKTAEGKTLSKTKKVATQANGLSAYAVIFDEQSHHFTKEPGMNPIIISTRQMQANDKLRAQGHLFLNEVYDLLGLPRTREGSVVGWVWRRENEPKNGDNYVSFGVFDGDKERAQAFIDGDEERIWLDFNVDGVVWDKI
jgi:hypothetical protein